MSNQSRFLDNKNGTITDVRKGLIWKQTDTMNDLKKWVNFQESLDYVRNLKEVKFAGYEDWRLPTYDEMKTFYDNSFFNKDFYDKDIHIDELFTHGGGFSMMCQTIPGRFKTWVLSLRDGSLDQPDGLWTLSESARAVRTKSSADQIR